MAKEIKTFSPDEFLARYLKPDAPLKKELNEEYGRFFMQRVKDMVGASQFPVPPTRATHHIIIFLTTGSASMKIGAQAVEIHKHECMVVPAGQVFSYDKYELNDGYICVFDNDFLLGKFGSNALLKEFEFLSIWGNPVIKSDEISGNFITQSFERVVQEYLKNGLKNSAVLQSYFLAGLCDLNMNYLPLSMSKSKTAVALTNQFKELLHSHIRSHHLVTDYAAMLNVSPNHLNKTVKQITQQSTSKWIAETLHLEAKVLLLQTKDSISEIAAALGIFDASYFSRLFKKREGISPLEYRKMIEKS